MAKAKNKPAKASTKSKVRKVSAAEKARLAALAAGARLKKVGEKEFDLSDYQAVKTPNGNSSLDCGDSLAKKLRGMDIEDVYKEYARLFGKEEADAMRQRYSKLNVGMQRMNLGNRMRAGVAAKNVPQSKAA